MGGISIHSGQIGRVGEDTRRAFESGEAPDGGDVFFRKAADWQRHPLLPGFSGSVRAPFVAGGNSIPDLQVLSVLEPAPPDDRAELLPPRRVRALAELANDLEGILALEGTAEAGQGLHDALREAGEVLNTTRSLLLEANTRRIQLLSC